MTFSEMLEKVKSNLKIEDDTRDLNISDVILSVMDYETVKGTGYQQDIASIKEGDGSITYATDGSNSREGVYGLSDADKTVLRRYRRLRGYV